MLSREAGKWRRVGFAAIDTLSDGWIDVPRQIKSDQLPEEEKRDEILKRLLRTPPSPRPKRERDKSVPSKGKKPKKETPAK